MSIADCAALVEKGDPDRFLATMSVPVAAREVLFPLYAFNVEVTRAREILDERAQECRRFRVLARGNASAHRLKCAR